MNIIITGASKGIGLGIAKIFALQKEKHCIGICARKPEELAVAEAQLRTISPMHEYFVQKCDVSKEEEVNQFVGEFESRYGSTDILINNAGFGIFKPVLEISKQEFESVLATNLRGVFLMTRAVLPSMRSKKTGTVITISSLAGKNGFTGGAAYCASKFAVRGMMQCLFLEVRKENIRVMTFFPGSVETEFFVHDVHGSQQRAINALAVNDVAACIELAVGLPQNADITEIDIRPTNPKG